MSPHKYNVTTIYLKSILKQRNWSLKKSNFAMSEEIWDSVD